MNLFPSFYAFLKFSKTRKKFNRTSSNLLDKIFFFFSKRSEEVLLNFFRVFENFKNASKDGNKFIVLSDRFCCFS